MIPDAAIVALSTSVSNHWSRKSTALIVISWIWLYLSGSDSAWKRRPRNSRSLQSARIERRGIRRRHGEDRLDEPPHLDHGLAVLVVGFGVEPRVPRDLPAGLGVIVDPPEVVAPGIGVNVPSSGSISRPCRGRSSSRMISGRAAKRRTEQTEYLKPGKISSVTAAPPTHVAPLEHQHLPPGAREIGGVDQAVVAGADDDGVEMHSAVHVQVPGAACGATCYVPGAKCLVLGTPVMRRSVSSECAGASPCRHVKTRA